MKDFWQAYWEQLQRGVVEAVKAAANRENYDIDPVLRAVVLAQLAMREARDRGLYPTTAQLEAETRQLA